MRNIKEGNIRDVGQQIWRFAEACGSLKQRPTLAKRNTYNYRRNDTMMREMIGRDNRDIYKMAASGDVADMKENEVHRRKTEIMVNFMYDGSGRAR